MADTSQEPETALQEPIAQTTEEPEHEPELEPVPKQDTEEASGNDEANGEETPTAEETTPAEREEAKGEESDNDEDDRKLFVGGLSWETQSKTLEDYMSKYGEVEKCTIKIDNKTGRSRCFGFVIFKNPESIQKVKDEKPHKLDGREIDAKEAEPQRNEGKLFVGGIKPDTSEEVIREYFSKYGKIEKVERPFDPKMNKPKGFCFVSFKKDGPIAKITQTRYHDVDGKQVECKHAEPLARGFGGGRGGRGGGRGGMGGGWGGPGGFAGGGGGGGGFGYGGGFNQGYGGFGGPGGYGGFGQGGGGGGYGGYGQGGFAGGFNQGFGAGGGGFGGGGFGGGGYGGGGGGGGYGFSNQQSGYGKSGRGRHMNNYKPY